MGASEILITDLVQQRLDVAKELGATHTLLLQKDQPAEETVKVVHQTMSSAPDKAIDCCGAESSARLAIFVRYYFLISYLLKRILLLICTYIYYAGYQIWRRGRRGGNGSSGGEAATNQRPGP